MKLEVGIESRILNGVLRAVQAVSGDCVVNVSDERISIRVVDASNAMAIDVSMAPSVFAAFDATEGKIGIDVDALYAKTNTFNADVDVRLVWDDYNRKISISGEGAKWGVRTIDPETVRKPPNVPNIDLPLDVQIDAERFRRMVKKAGLVSDHVTIGFGLDEGETEEAFYISSLGDTDDFRENVFDKDVKIKTSAVLDTLYSLDMLAMIAKNLEGDVQLRLGRDMPAIFDYDLGDVPIMYLLAPRIEKKE